MKQDKHLGRGIVAGVAAGLVASWVMNVFMAGPGKKLQQAVESPEERQKKSMESEEPKEDATMKAADAVVNVATGGKHLSWQARQTAGPVVHYAFGALMGGLYGGLAEIWPAVRAGCGTTFAAALFAGADLIAVPALRLGSSPDELPLSAEASPLAAHIVYGLTTELVRRAGRLIL